MFMNVVCPICGEKYRAPESALGKQANCPACSGLFQCGSVSPPSLEARPVRAAGRPLAQQSAQVRAVGNQAEPVVHYGCPRCGKALESPAHMTGQKLNCPDCGQRLQVPQQTQPPVNPVVRIVSPQPASPTPPAAPPPAPVREVIPVAVAADTPAPARRENCLECGRDVTERPRVQTCPDCGSLFCSAMCFREHHYHAHSSRR
jgi:DNA-directed RNA polymerase subunit RPC12/RpoP